MLVNSLEESVSLSHFFDDLAHLVHSFRVISTGADPVAPERGLFVRCASAFDSDLLFCILRRSIVWLFCKLPFPSAHLANSAVGCIFEGRVASHLKDLCF